MTGEEKANVQHAQKRLAKIWRPVEAAFEELDKFFGFCFHKSMPIILCLCCNTRVRLAEFRTHCRSSEHKKRCKACHMPIRSTNRDLCDRYYTSIVSRFNHMSQPFTFTEDYITEDGISCMPVYDGFACVDDCGDSRRKVGTSEDSVKRHHSKCNRSKVLLQQLHGLVLGFTNASSRYTVVAERMEVDHSVYSENTLLANAVKVLAQMKGGATADDASEILQQAVNPFYKKAMYPEFLKSEINWSAAVEACKLEKFSSRESSLKRALKIIIVECLMKANIATDKSVSQLRKLVKGGAVLRSTGDFIESEDNDSSSDGDELNGDGGEGGIRRHSRSAAFQSIQF